MSHCKEVTRDGGRGRATGEGEKHTEGVRFSRLLRARIGQ
jgi:hypothetical protein